MPGSLSGLGFEQHAKLRTTYLIMVLVFSLYCLVLPLVYHVTRFNALILPPWLLVLATPLVYVLSRNYRTSCLYLLLAASYAMIALDYIAGGIMAVGVMALGLGPVAGGILLGRKGVNLGLGLSLFGISLVIALSAAFPPPNINLELDIVYQRSLANVLLFSVLTFVLFRVFFELERRKRRIIEDQNNHINQLISVITHDIATPLSVAALKLDLLAGSDSLDDANRRHVEDLKSVIGLVAEQRRQVMDMRALDGGKLDVEVCPIVLRDCLQQSVEFFEPLAAGKGVRILSDIRLNDEALLGNQTVIQQQIIGNLLGNAIKFSPRGSEVRLGAQRQGDELVVEVIDRGVGIPPHILQHIFSLNSKTNRPGTEGEAGTGYGLPMVKRFVERLGGSVYIASRERDDGDGASGTTVTLRFPVA